MARVPSEAEDTWSPTENTAGIGNKPWSRHTHAHSKLRWKNRRRQNKQRREAAAGLLTTRQSVSINISAATENCDNGLQWSKICRGPSFSNPGVFTQDTGAGRRVTRRSMDHLRCSGSSSVEGLGKSIQMGCTVHSAGDVLRLHLVKAILN